MRIALQTIIFGANLKEHPLLELERAHSAGFRRLEVGPLLFESVEHLALLNFLEAHDMQIVAVHTFLESLRDTQAQHELGKLIRQFSCNNVVSSGVINGGYRPSDYLETAQHLGAIGKTLSRFAGRPIAMHYHHYDFDIADFHNIDTLLSVNDELRLAFDTYWAYKAGRSLSTTWARYVDSIGIVHIKDGDPTQKTFLPAGAGDLRDSLVDLLRKMQKHTRGPDLLVYEQDHAGYHEVPKALASSFEFLARNGGEK